MVVHDDLTSQKKLVSVFGGGSAEGGADQRDLLGGKGANLAEMAFIGLPVPPGFTITTAVCEAYYQNNRKLPEKLRSEVASGLSHIANITGTKFGDVDNPIVDFCSVR